VLCRSSGADFCATNRSSSKQIRCLPHRLILILQPPDSTPLRHRLFAGDGLTLQSWSPAYCQGVDPTTLPGVPAQVAADMITRTTFITSIQTSPATRVPLQEAAGTSALINTKLHALQRPTPQSLTSQTRMSYQFSNSHRLRWF